MCGATGHTCTAAFWTLLSIMQNANVVGRLREDCEHPKVVTKRGGSPTRKVTISVWALQKSFRIPTALFQEHVRLQGNSFDYRIVEKDALLADKYLLKKGSLVILEGNFAHRGAGVWGEDAYKVKDFRFYESESATFIDKENERLRKEHMAAWRGFGGGASLCPGPTRDYGDLSPFVKKLTKN